MVKNLKRMRRQLEREDRVAEAQVCVCVCWYAKKN